ncbi:MAG: GNAT family N-acetyltransferase [Cyclobacteriaceae bacterium]
MAETDSHKAAHNIKTAGHEDLDKIARCQKQAFPGSLSSAMGLAYLRKMLEWYIVQPSAFLFYIEEDGKCAGYCGGFLVDGSLATGSASGMLQHSFNKAVWSFVFRPWLLMHKEMRAKIPFAVRNVRRKLGLADKQKEQKIKETHRPPTEPYTGLVVIGNDPAYRGKGYGSGLLREFERVSIKKGVKLMRLTVNAQNETAIKSYKRNGWYTANDLGNTHVMEKKI